MDYSEVKKLQIKNELNEWDKRIGVTTDGMNSAIERWRRLGDAGFHIESLVINAQMVEHSIKMILAGYAAKRRVLAILDETDPFADVKIDDIEEQTLGTLINRLRRFTGQTPFIENATRLNNFRTEIVHHLFNGNKEIDKLDAESHAFIGTVVPQISQQVKGAAHKIDDEIKELVPKTKNPS